MKAALKKLLEKEMTILEPLKFQFLRFKKKKKENIDYFADDICERIQIKVLFHLNVLLLTLVSYTNLKICYSSGCTIVDDNFWHVA